MFNARINEAMEHGSNWNKGDVLCCGLETVVHRDASSAVAIHGFGPKKTQFISRIIERTFVDITKVGCPPLTIICLPTISCTFPYHKSKHISALRTTCSLVQMLNFHFLTQQYKKCPPQPGFL